MKSLIGGDPSLKFCDKTETLSLNPIFVVDEIVIINRGTCMETESESETTSTIIAVSKSEFFAY